MPDDMTASRASGFGATEQTDDNSEQIAELLDQVRDLMIEDGTDPATAEALTNYARPATPAIAGNLADLMRMGQIAVTGKIDTPPGQDDIETADLEEAFVNPNPPVGPDPVTGLQTPLGTTEGTDGDGGEDDVEADDGEDGGLDAMTKADLLLEAESRGIEVSGSWTKQEIIDRLNEG